MFSHFYGGSPGYGGGLIMSKVGAAVPTRKAAMEIEAGGGVDVREGQASVSWVIVVTSCCRCRDGHGLGGIGRLLLLFLFLFLFILLL